MRVVRAFTVATAGSVVANLLLLFAVRPFVIDPAMPLEILSVGAITLFTIGGAVGAAIVYAVMRRMLARPDRPFAIVSVVVLLASFVPDYLIIGETTGTFAGTNTGSALLLMLMHAVEAAIVVPCLIRLWGRR